MTSEHMHHVELFQAKKFLQLYNGEMGTNFRLANEGHQEPPDIKCFDEETELELFLEVTMMENKPGDLELEMKYLRGEPITIPESTGVIDFQQDIIPRLKERLDDKLKANYGKMPVALVIGRVAAFDARLEWETLGRQFLQDYFQDYENNFPEGIWLFVLGENGDELLRLA